MPQFALRMFAILGFSGLIITGIHLFGDYRVWQIRSLNAQARRLVDQERYIAAYATYLQLSKLERSGDPEVDELIFQAPNRAQEIQPRARLERAQRNIGQKLRLREEDEKARRAALLEAAISDTTLTGAERRLKVVLDGSLFDDPRDVILRQSHFNEASLGVLQHALELETMIRYEIVARRKTVGTVGFEFSLVIDHSTGATEEYRKTSRVVLYPPKSHDNPTDLWKVMAD